MHGVGYPWFIRLGAMGGYLLVASLMTLVCGCAAPRTAVPAGEALRPDRVTIERSLIQSGGVVGDELEVTPGRYGGVIITAGRDKAEAISLYLPRSGMESYSGHLEKLVAWGETARQEKIDTVKSVGTVSAQADPGDGPAGIATRFISTRGGESWLGQSRFCQLHGASGEGAAAPSGGSDLCAREMTFYLRPAATRSLLEILTRRLSTTAR
jgi:hypothetical protein